MKPLLLAGNFPTALECFKELKRVLLDEYEHREPPDLKRALETIEYALECGYAKNVTLPH